ncbi:hypothetical protein PZ938_00720 [Luteipulveratus sp. YIM 133132]|uniref:hypothetical protein n=1 Tax=Luteipulveratus flavus TaxID=3031728 RepID=UPI0023AEBE02|nr:hypothetical protein [Luteipulveratus sp. YIM 133132]MDE9364117.1 hypothetical protein [Luteipulveratus sp. YIM 133132]
MRVEQRFRGADTISGFVVGIGSKWVMLAAVRDGGYEDGYVAVRRKNIRNVARDRSFEEQFARQQPDWPPRMPPDTDLDSTAELVRGLARRYPLLGIEREDKRTITSVVVHSAYRRALAQMAGSAEESGSSADGSVAVRLPLASRHP